MALPLYALALLVSLAGTLALDHRWRLFVFARPGPALATIGIGVALLTAWDLAFIRLGVFHRGDSPAYLGWELAPHLPVEELLFLTLLCESAMVAWCGATRWFVARDQRGAPVGGAR